MPGKYTVRLRVKGPKGEDVEVKTRYIEVGDGGGSGDGPQPKPKPKPKPKQEGAAGAKKKQEPSERPKVNLMPDDLKHHKPGTNLVEKDVNVYRPPPPGTPGAAEQVPLDAVLPEYRRAAEDSMERERIPAALREHLRRYYEGLRPK
jgi:PKD repeat protein